MKSNYTSPMHYTFKYPDNDKLTPTKIQEFSDYIGAIEKSLKSDEYKDYLELNSFALWILGQDIIGNHDYAGSNIFLFIKALLTGEKVKMACLWDFDGIMAVSGFAPVHNLFYFQDLFKKNDFKKRYISIYDKISHKAFRDIKFFIRDFAKSEYGKSYARSYERDRKLWEDYDSTYVSFEERINKALGWFDKRESKLNSLVKKMRVTTSILSTTNSNETNDKKYYDLMGRRYNDPKKGINIKDGKKIIIKN